MRDLFLARQPIFDAQHRIAAYELLYRGSADAETAEGALAVDRKSGSVIVDALLSMGLSRVTEGHKAFINVSEAVLLSGFGGVLDPDAVVVELLETLRPTREVVAACRDLRARGFRLALDDQSHRTDPGELLELVDIVKVDVLDAAERLEDVVRALAPRRVELLAEKVEDAGMHDRCTELGFHLFQGFHYYRPETLRGRDLDGAASTMLRLLAMLGDLSVTDRVIEDAFMADPGLSYKLLRMVNSASLGGRGVESLGHAMRLVGRDPLQRWLALLLLAGGRGSGQERVELIKAALLRGRMCELLGGAASARARREMPGGSTLFLVGLLSYMDVLLGCNLARILEDVAVSPAVRGALLSRQGPAGAVLDGVTRYAEADWDGAAACLRDAGVAPEAMGRTYLEALSWAGAHMALHEPAA